MPSAPDGNEVPLVVGDAAVLLDAAFPTGAPHPTCALLGSISYSGQASNGGYVGGQDGTGVLVCNVPNWIDTEPEKRLRLQVTYRGTEPGTLVIGFLGVPGSSEDVDEFVLARTDDTDPQLPNGFSYFYEDWKLFPNPDWEQVVIFVPASTFIDQVVIDTISGPVTPGDIPVFSDGFETGDTTRWSSTVP